MARHDLLISFKPFTGVWKTQLFAAFPFPRRANDRRGAFPARPDTIRIFPIDRAVPRPRQPAARVDGATIPQVPVEMGRVASISPFTTIFT